MKNTCEDEGLFQLFPGTLGNPITQGIVDNNTSRTTTAAAALEAIVADITDRSLLSGSHRRKRGIEDNFSSYKIRDYMNEDNQSMNINNFTLGGAYFQSMGVVSANSAKKEAYQEEARMDTNNIQSQDRSISVFTPSSSTCKIEEEIVLSERDQHDEDDDSEEDEDSYCEGGSKSKGTRRTPKNNGLKNIPTSAGKKNYNSKFTTASKKKTNTKSKISRLDQCSQYLPKSRNYLNIYYFIFKFKILLKNSIFYRNIFKLTSKQLKFINDLSFGEDLLRNDRSQIFSNQKQKSHSSHQKKSSFSNSYATCFRMITGFYLKIPVLNPDSCVCIIEEIIMVYLCISQLLLLPIESCFEVSIQGHYLRLLVSLFLVVDMAFTLSKPYYSQGAVVRNRLLILYHYISSTEFITDFIPTFALILDTFYPLKIYTLCFLLKMQTVQKLFESISEHFQLQQRIPVIFQLFQLVYLIFLVAHLTGCGFYYIGSQSDPIQNWIVQKDLFDSSIFEQYIASVYFAIITMITVGFGDIVPINKQERIYVIFMTSLSCGVFAYAINTIATIIKDRQQEEHELKQNKNYLLTYMGDRNVPKNAQQQVIRYLEYAHRSQNDSSNKGREILHSMSKQIQDQFYLEFFNRILCGIPLFSNFSVQLRNELVFSAMTEVVFTPGETILQSEKPTQNLYHVISGEVSQIAKKTQGSATSSSQSSSTFISLIKQGEYFDESAFISGQACEYEYISQTVCQAVAISRVKFLEIITAYRLDYQIFILQTHNHSFNPGNSSSIQKPCVSCQNVNHSVFNCPFIHYESNKDLLIKRYLSSLPQQRVEQERSKKHRFEHLSVRKQFRNFRLRLPKIYDHTPFLIQQEIFEAERLFDIDQLWECDDQDFLQLAPEIQYNFDTDDIEQIIIIDEEDEYLEQDEELIYNQQLQQQLKEEGGDTSLQKFEDSSEDLNGSSDQTQKNKILIKGLINKIKTLDSEIIPNSPSNAMTNSNNLPQMDVLDNVIGNIENSSNTNTSSNRNSSNNPQKQSHHLNPLYLQRMRQKTPRNLPKLPRQTQSKQQQLSPNFSPQQDPMQQLFSNSYLEDSEYNPNRNKSLSMIDQKQQDELTVIKEHPSMASLDSSSSAIKQSRLSSSINEISNYFNAANNLNQMNTLLSNFMKSQMQQQQSLQSPQSSRGSLIQQMMHLHPSRFQVIVNNARKSFQKQPSNFTQQMKIAYANNNNIKNTAPSSSSGSIFQQSATMRLKAQSNSSNHPQINTTYTPSSSSIYTQPNFHRYSSAVTCSAHTPVSQLRQGQPQQKQFQQLISQIPCGTCHSEQHLDLSEQGNLSHSNLSQLPNIINNNKKESFIQLDRFDSMRVFELFLPHNNYDQVLLNIKGNKPKMTQKSVSSRRKLQRPMIQSPNNFTKQKIGSSRISSTMQHPFNSKISVKSFK